MSELEAGSLVRHVHRRFYGEVRAVADGFAMVKWPDWDKPDLCDVRDLRPAVLPNPPEEP